jgi:hypothetical protein
MVGKIPRNPNQKDVVILSASINALLGSALVVWIGTHFLGFSLWDCIVCIIGTNVAAFFAMILILQLEWVPAIKRNVLTRSRRTWPVFLMLYYGILLALAPAVRGWRPLAILFLPLALSNGFGILAFGPVQDWLVARNQRRTRKAALSRAPAR